MRSAVSIVASVVFGRHCGPTGTTPRSRIRLTARNRASLSPDQNGSIQGVAMYTRILVPVDGSATAERGLREAMQWAAQTKAELVLLHVVDDDTPSIELAPARYADDVRKAHERVAEELVAGYVRLAHESGIRAWGVVRDGLGNRVSD